MLNQVKKKFSLIHKDDRDHGYEKAIYTLISAIEDGTLIGTGEDAVDSIESNPGKYYEIRDSLNYLLEDIEETIEVHETD